MIALLLDACCAVVIVATFCAGLCAERCRDAQAIALMFLGGVALGGVIWAAETLATQGAR